VEASALKHRSALRGPTPLLRLQGDDRLVALTRRGSQPAYETLVARYQARLLAFCRHMLASREDAEDVLQEVFAAAFSAMLADDRPINVRPWLYRIARNRCLNHLRRQTAVGVDSMDVHLADHGSTTADKVHKREEFRELVGDVQTLPETQRTALLLREIDALSYEQIAEAMDTTVPAIKSLLVRARVSLAEAAEARRLSCEEVRFELGEVAEGLLRRSPPIRRHVRECDRCRAFDKQLGATNRALAAVFPVGPLLLLKKFLVAQSGAAGAAGAAGGGAAATGAAAGAGSALTAGLSTVATKTAAGLAAAAIVTAGAVEVDHVRDTRRSNEAAAPALAVAAPAAVPPRVLATVPQPQDVSGAKAPPGALSGETPGLVYLLEPGLKPVSAVSAAPPAPTPVTVVPAATVVAPAPAPAMAPAGVPDVAGAPQAPVQAGGDTVTLPTRDPFVSDAPAVPAATPVAPAPTPAPTPAPAPPAAAPAVAPGVLILIPVAPPADALAGATEDAIVEPVVIPIVAGGGAPAKPVVSASGRAPAPVIRTPATGAVGAVGGGIVTVSPGTSGTPVPSGGGTSGGGTAGGAPDPTPTPAPAPEPEPTPEPEPAPEPAPAPQPEPDLVPVPEPEPDPVPVPDPEPVPDPVPVPDPEPVPDPVPAPDPAPIADPAPAPAPTPVPAP
jgi:RNA polymerase sigma factor (sigma-70 family)